MRRRRFIQYLSASGALFSTGTFPVEAFTREELVRLVILHTNDVHSRIEPFPMDGSRMQGMGGAARRAALIAEVRAREPHVLVLDSGDIFQGTPYFNVYGGELEFKLMSEMGYDAATIGNHDFDAGLDGLVKQLPHASFPFLISNYDFRDTDMDGQTEDYRIFHRGGLKVGIFGLGIELQGLVPAKLYGNTGYLDPVTHARRVVGMLKGDHSCDLVICLSHLGYRYRSPKISDVVLARETSGIDLILGGHTHTFLDEPEIILNAAGKPVIINQVGWAGVRLGRIDITFEHNRKNKCVTCHNQWLR
jgi:5'-nucleotidase